ncbi:MAG: hypothetical protein KGL53_11415, partial [Elusimicrobia bacterium]|nr:hypothetical protein [Elusimicrobiota bacterium]
MFLAVTPLEEFWDKSDQLVFLGPWCARPQRRAEWTELSPHFLPNPWRDLTRFQAAAQYCRGVSSRLLDQLVSYLNGTLGVSRSRRVWRLLLDPWLTYHVEQMYDHYVHVDDALRAEPGLRTLLLDPECYTTPLSTAHFMRLSVGDFFHLQMFSHILAAKLPGSPVRGMALPDDPPPAARMKGLLKKTAATLARTCARAGGGEILVSELGLRRGERLRLILRSGLRILPYLSELPVSAAPARDARREGLSRLQGRDDFERVFIAALPRHLPALFLEGHAAAADFTRARIGRTPRAAFTTVDCHYTDSF